MSYAERLDAHWNALPLARKFRILSYLARRLVRISPPTLAEIREESACAIAGFVKWVGERYGETARLSDAAMAGGRGLVSLGIDRARAMLRPQIRHALYKRVRAGLIDLAPQLIAIALLMGGLALLLPEPDAEPHRLTIVEQARIARTMRPPPCYLTSDGEVWIDAEGGPFRPGRRDYLERRREICGF